MKILETVDLDVLRRHEASTDANVTLGSYWMDEQAAPAKDFCVYRCVLGTQDIERLFLLGEFAKHTRRGTCLLRDVLPEMRSAARVLELHQRRF